MTLPADSYTPASDKDARKALYSYYNWIGLERQTDKHLDGDTSVNDFMDYLNIVSYKNNIFVRKKKMK